jgi:hypothetical protein
MDSSSLYIGITTLIEALTTGWALCAAASARTAEIRTREAAGRKR